MKNLVFYFLETLFIRSIFRSPSRQDVRAYKIIKFQGLVLPLVALTQDVWRSGAAHFKSRLGFDVVFCVVCIGGGGELSF